MENVQLNWKAKAACNENFVVMQTTEKKKNFLKIIKISEVQKEFPPTESHALSSIPLLHWLPLLLWRNITHTQRWRN